MNNYLRWRLSYNAQNISSFQNARILSDKRSPQVEIVDMHQPDTGDYFSELYHPINNDPDFLTDILNTLNKHIYPYEKYNVLGDKIKHDNIEELKPKIYGFINEQVENPTNTLRHESGITRGKNLEWQHSRFHAPLDDFVESLDHFLPSIVAHTISSLITNRLQQGVNLGNLYHTHPIFDYYKDKFSSDKDAVDNLRKDLYKHILEKHLNYLENRKTDVLDHYKIQENSDIKNAFNDLVNNHFNWAKSVMTKE